jgi:hypothetical protein
MFLCVYLLLLRTLSINHNTARPIRTVKLLNGTQSVWASDRNFWSEKKKKIWSENLDKIKMRSIFARYLRNIDQIFPLIYRDKISGLTGQAIKWKAPLLAYIGGVRYLLIRRCTIFTYTLINILLNICVFLF